jgi:hypothetical protein
MAVTKVVLALQALVVLAFYFDASDPPELAGLTLVQDLWALAHKPSFYPVAGLVVIGVPGTAAAMLRRGRHRVWLAVGWGLFAWAMWAWDWHRLSVMLDVLWRHRPSSI